MPFDFSCLILETEMRLISYVDCLGRALLHFGTEPPGKVLQDNLYPSAICIPKDYRITIIFFNDIHAKKPALYIFLEECHLLIYGNM
jgi:hypothetical protein